jgi:hypothetical protein
LAGTSEKNNVVTQAANDAGPAATDVPVPASDVPVPANDVPTQAANDVPMLASPDGGEECPGFGLKGTIQPGLLVTGGNLLIKILEVPTSSPISFLFRALFSSLNCLSQFTRFQRAET